MNGIDPGQKRPLRCRRAARAVRRTDEGAIDVAYYERRTRRLRVRWLHMALRSVVRSMVQWYRRRLAAAELRALDDRSLHDLGISRGDILAIAEGSYSRDPSRRLRGGGSTDRTAARSCAGLGDESAESSGGGERMA